MGFWNSDEALAGLTEDTLDAALGLEELRQGREPSVDLDALLLVITSELCDWGLDSVEQFHVHLLPIHTCQQILRRRDGYAAWGKLGQTVTDMYNAIYPDYHNLLQMLSHRNDADLRKAKDFCLLLNDVGLAQFKPHRRGLAA